MDSAVSAYHAPAVFNDCDHIVSAGLGKQRTSCTEAHLCDDGTAGRPGEDLDLARRVHHDPLQRRVALLLAQRDHLRMRQQVSAFEA